MRHPKFIVGVVAAVLAAALAMPAFAATSTVASGTADTQTSVGVASTAQEKAAERRAARAAAKAAAKEKAEQAKAARKAAREKAAKAKAARKTAAKAKAENAKRLRTERLTKNVENRLSARKARFDAVNANIAKRIARIAALANRVEAAGGEVGAVRARLDEASSALAQAATIEITTAQQLRAIPGAQNRKAAFDEAKATGRTAVTQLKLARTALRDATTLLRAEIERLRGTGSVDATSTAQ